MVNQNVKKNRLFEELMKIKDWRHPFDFGRNRVVDLERAELGPWNKWRGEVSRQSIEMVMDIESFTILDLACSDGYYSFELADKAARVVGLDARSEAIRRANLIKYFYGYTNFEFKQADLREYDLSKEEGKSAFDLVLCYGIVYHLTDPYDFLSHAFEVTKDTLSLSTFLSSNEAPVLLVTKEDVSMAGSGLDPISIRPSHQAVVRLLYGIGFDLVLRYIPHKLSLYDHLEWGHYFGIKLGDRSREDYLKRHSVRTIYDRSKKENQLILCEDVYDATATKRIGVPLTFKSSLFYKRFIGKVKRRIQQLR